MFTAYELRVYFRDAILPNLRRGHLYTHMMVIYLSFTVFAAPKNHHRRKNHELYGFQVKTLTTVIKMKSTVIK